MGKSLRLEKRASDQARGSLDADTAPLFTPHGAVFGI
jgi:hypothetical protein